MVSLKSVQQAGLTEGEAKVYLALLKIGISTTGPIIEESGVANWIIYRILNSLIDKGLVAYITKEKTKYFSAANPQRIIDFIEERKEKLDDDKNAITKILPQLLAMTQQSGETSIQIYEGFKGFLTAWELCHVKLKKGDEYHCLGIYPVQEEKFHAYWKKDHKRRVKTGFKGKMLFNKGTSKEILKNRNSYWGCESRYMPSDMQTPAWFVVFKDVVSIYLQTRKFEDDGTLVKKPLSIVIFNKEIAKTFEAYFQDYWKRSKPFEHKK